MGLYYPAFFWLMRIKHRSNIFFHPSNRLLPNRLRTDWYVLLSSVYPSPSSGPPYPHHASPPFTYPPLPSVFENYVETLNVDGTMVELSLWDTAGESMKCRTEVGGGAVTDQWISGMAQCLVDSRRTRRVRIQSRKIIPS